MNYRLAVKFEAIWFLDSLRKVDHNRLMWWLERLRGAPFTTGQAVAVDSEGREIQISVVDRFRIFYWTDHAVKTVQVVKIEQNG